MRSIDRLSVAFRSLPRPLHHSPVPVRGVLCSVTTVRSGSGTTRAWADPVFDERSAGLSLTDVSSPKLATL